MKKGTVLIVEDSHYLAESLEDLLEIHDFSVTIAPNGRKGIELALELKPDLTLLDIRLPDITGYDVFHAIREDVDWGKDAKISILTASESIESISKNVDLPVEHVLFKPEWSLADLLKYIEARVAS